MQWTTHQLFCQMLSTENIILEEPYCRLSDLVQTLGNLNAHDKFNAVWKLEPNVEEPLGVKVLLENGNEPLDYDTACELVKAFGPLMAHSWSYGDICNLLHTHYK